MKSLTKLFVAVAVLLAGFACTTDATEDLGTAVGCQTEITLSLEESRTQLGAKADGVYPITWSADDAISINGTPSTSTTLANGGSIATFKFDGILSYPYEVAYPAAAKGKVIFAAQQNHTDGTFANGAATMYAYAEDKENIALTHLTGVLKIGLTGNGAKITHAQISNVGRTPIAGEFAFDFADGKLVATSASEAIIDYSFGEGLTLSDNATYMHVAVPAGIYDELYITLFDNEGGAMYATIKADDSKPLTAGTVREFTNTLVYVADTSSYIIKDKESLLAWAAQAETSSGCAVMVADIDMTGEAWTSVNGFSGIFRGNGHTIKGLTAPLFGETNAAAITGVHLEDVDINIENSNYVGAVAMRIIPTEGSYIKHCSVSGKITVTRNDSPTVATFVGGVVARSMSTAELSHLVNKADIVLNGAYAAVQVGGVVGHTVCDISNSTNLGTITVNGSCSGILYIGGVARGCVGLANCINGSKDNGEVGKIVLNGTNANVAVVGGIVETADTNLENCHNYANLYHNGTSTSTVQLCGLVRMNHDYAERNNCTNYGDMIVAGSATAYILGGFETRHFNRTTYTSCHNYGDIIVKEASTAPDIYAGGLIGTCDDTGEVCHIYKCSNKGNISVYSSYATTVYLGGMCGKLEAGQLLMAEVDNVESINENYGDILYDAKNSGATVYAGGSVGILCDNLTSGVTSVSSAHRISYFTNYGDITINGECKTAQIGGFIGRYAKGTGKGATLNYSLIESRNKGNMTVNAAVKGDCAIGGMMGFHIHNFATAKGNWINEGKMTFTGSVEGGRLLIGGYMAATDRALSGTNCTVYNFGDVEVTGKVDETKNYRIGGIYGQTNKTFANCHNYCNIVAVGYQHVGMLTGCDRSSTVNGTGCSVGGTICLSGDVEDETLDVISLNESNYFNYMYGSLESTKWGETAYDGCVLLTEKPNI